MEDLLFKTLTQLNTGEPDHDELRDIFKSLVMLSWNGSPVLRRLASEVLLKRFDTFVGP